VRSTGLGHPNCYPRRHRISDELHAFVRDEILTEFGRTYKDWIQECYIERMKQILSDPAEFGKGELEFKRKKMA